MVQHKRREHKPRRFSYPFFAEFLYEVVGRAGKLLRQGYFGAHQQVAALAAANRHSLAFDTQRFSMRDPCRDRKYLLAVKRGNFIFSSKKSVGEFYRKFGC